MERIEIIHLLSEVGESDAFDVSTVEHAIADLPWTNAEKRLVAEAHSFLRDLLMPKKGGKFWCVKHRDGWCILADQNVNSPCPICEESNVPTKCGHVVVLPWGMEYTVPTCAECISKE